MQERLNAEQSTVRVVVMAPPDVVAHLKKIMLQMGIEQIDSYHGQTTFTPKETAQPAIGEIGRENTEPEVKLEMQVDARLVADLRKRVEAAHTYEAFAFEVYPLTEASSSPQEYDADYVKLRVKTTEPQLAMQAMTELGAGEIGEYTECYFTYRDDNDPEFFWVETIAPRSLFNQASIAAGSTIKNDQVIEITQLLEHPVGYRDEDDTLKNF